ncbi:MULTISPECIES: flagellar hook-length control protein FliK [unclassified Pseudodesulfovibrio]|uniref:flagellar hook-length control protein FliK n=1 Tax=unclassified Pseudodesulfovibrio TaxID=2661612 RepID=UPI000FEBCFF5|nr:MULTISPECIES: flagellar hook-length control protein FliK [unclassified Pseudodesulfovibrio]MCJ2166254.1 flagellar hook-length control protein FliK [Pseudodesulfovibrio sp. S3-i]RWU02286.1 flagellar hook-length control protein FliK [Pseudodesulfovibrio sp. S3]
MQNIPGIAIETATEQVQLVKLATSKKNDTSSRMADGSSDKQTLFSDVFDEHTEKVEEELALAPISHKQKMIESAPKKAEEKAEEAVNAAGNKVAPQDPVETAKNELETRMTQEDLDKVKDDLKEYGMSDEEIAQIEKQVNSEEGMTWKQFAAAIADKIAEMRTSQMTDTQKEDLNSFFGKLGFTDEESNKLISKLDSGNYAEVMTAVQAKIDAMPEGQQLLLNAEEVGAFTSAMGFSKEFTVKIQEMLGSNTLPKDLKEAFTLIRQEAAELDQKDQQLVRVVGKAFAETMGDTLKESSAARQIEQAVDLKPRVAEQGVKTEIKEEMAQAFRTRDDAMTDARVRDQAEKALADKVDIKPDTAVEVADNNQDMHTDDQSDRNWDNLFGKMHEDTQQTGKDQAQTRATVADTTAKGILAQADAKAAATNTRAWEKVSAPKVMKQVDDAVLKTLNNGTKQLTLQLTPENLGKLSIVLTVQGKEVGATIKAESPDAAKVIAENIDIIKNSLEAQGLKVEKLEVQTGLTDNQNYQDWFGESEHNLSREREAMIAMRNHMRNMRQGDGTGVAQDMQLLREQAINADQGLHLIA